MNVSGISFHYYYLRRTAVYSYGSRNIFGCFAGIVCIWEIILFKNHLFFLLTMGSAQCILALKARSQIKQTV